MASGLKKLAYVVCGVGIGAVAGAAIAPVLGGWIGVNLLGLNGAAASSAGLASLGGGSLATGGYGMAGGIVAGARVGAGVGAAAGTVVSQVSDHFNGTKFCSNCGRDLNRSNNFCPHCGTQI